MATLNEHITIRNKKGGIAFASQSSEGFKSHHLRLSTKNVKVEKGESFKVENLIFDVKSFIAGVFN
jgi:hypothetical protein